MVAISTQHVNKFISSPDPSIKAVLVYGPDDGLVRENTKKLAQKLSRQGQEMGEIISLDDNDLGSNPERLAVEVQTISMFGGRKIVCVRAGRHTDITLLEHLLQGQECESYLIIEGGDLKKTAKLRQIFEKSKQACALPCYADDGKNLAHLIDEELKGAGLSISSQHRDYLASQLGADRGVSRSEIRKLALYAYGKTEITREDIDEMIGDSSNLTIEMIIHSALTGKLSESLMDFERAIAAGFAGSAILAILNSHLVKLHRVRTEMDNGESLEGALRKMRPPLHFKQQDAFKAQISRWSSKKIMTALDLVQQTTLRCRTKAALEVTFIERLLISLCQLSAR